MGPHEAIFGPLDHTRPTLQHFLGAGMPDWTFLGQIMIHLPLAQWFCPQEVFAQWFGMVGYKDCQDLGGYGKGKYFIHI